MTQTAETFLRYETGGPKGKPGEWHQWACIAIDRSFAVHVHAHRDTEGGWYGGVETHTKPADGEKRSHEHCPFLNGACRHDGSSLYFEECWKARCVMAIEDHCPHLVLQSVEIEFRQRVRDREDY